MKYNIFAAMLALASVACSHQPALTPTAATGGVQAANAVGANDIPQAALHLQLAAEETDLSKQLAADHQDDEAKSMMLRVDADSELAAALAKQKSEADAAAAATERVRVLEKAQ